MENIDKDKTAPTLKHITVGMGTEYCGIMSLRILQFLARVIISISLICTLLDFNAVDTCENDTDMQYFWQLRSLYIYLK